MTGSLPSAAALASWGRLIVFVVEIGAGAEAVTIRDLAKDFELSGREEFQERIEEASSWPTGWRMR
jgi:hypothetical protein